MIRLTVGRAGVSWPDCVPGASGEGHREVSDICSVPTDHEGE
jgi:hypothetical protein